MNFSHLTLLKTQLDHYRPLPDPVVRNLRENVWLRWTYHTNAIEGNTLTLKETKVVLEGITVGGKTLREQLEVINHQHAIEFVETLAQGVDKLSEWQNKSIHQLVLKYLDDENAGTYRTNNVLIAGAQHRPPSFLQVPFEMANFMEQYHTEWVTQQPVERAARVHSEMEKIHPFADGNGRTARLLMSLELLKGGFPAVVLPEEQRLTYYETLDKAHVEGDYEPFLALIGKLVEERFAAYWYALGIE